MDADATSPGPFCDVILQFINPINDDIVNEIFKLKVNALLSLASSADPRHWNIYFPMAIIRFVFAFDIAP